LCFEIHALCAPKFVNYLSGKKWDTAAPEAILTEAGGEIMIDVRTIGMKLYSGGRLTDCHGSALRYSADVQHMNSAGVVATGVGVDHDEYIRHIPEHVKQKLIAKL
jgi:3'(2'), 5'-bisphosphate nucleotidase